MLEALNAGENEMRTDGRGRKKNIGEAEVQRSEGEGGEEKNAEPAVSRHLKVCCVCRHLAASIVSAHPYTNTTTTSIVNLSLHVD